MTNLKIDFLDPVVEVLNFDQIEKGSKFEFHSKLLFIEIPYILVTVRTLFTGKAQL